MRRVLAYCAFLYGEEVSNPLTGVDGAEVKVLSQDRLRLLWSEVEWPFRQGALQQNALEFHRVIEHVFRRTAVIPFRLLSIFDDVAALEKFAAEQATHFIADLERLRVYVQMESVVYVIAQRQPADSGSGREYLEHKAEVLRLSTEHAAKVRDAITGMSREVQIREVKRGTRIFALVQRGDEERFRKAVESVPLPESVSRRVSGPWPAAEFLSEAVKKPQIAGQH